MKDKLNVSEMFICQFVKTQKPKMLRSIFNMNTLQTAVRRLEKLRCNKEKRILLKRPRLLCFQTTIADPIIKIGLSAVTYVCNFDKKPNR
jgi:hypothetical protein